MKNKVVTALSVISILCIMSFTAMGSDAEISLSESTLKGQGTTSKLQGAPSLDVVVDYHEADSKYILLVDIPDMEYPMPVKVTVMSYDPTASSPSFSTVYETDGRIPQSKQVSVMMESALSQTSDTLRYEIFISKYNGIDLLAQATLLVKQYRVSFDNNNGSGSFDDQIVDYGSVPSEPASGSFYKDCYSFLYYSEKSDGTETAITAFDKDTYLYAIYAPAQYQVSFNGNVPTAGSHQTMGPATLTYDLPEPLPANEFVYAGYTFVGWNKDSTSTSVLYTDGETVKNICGTTGSDPVSVQDVILYAVWSADTFNLIYDGNRPSAATSDVTGVPVGTTALQSNATVTAGPAPSLTGWTFQNWNTKANGSGTDYAAGSPINDLVGKNGSVVSLYAIWNKNSYTIDYDVNIPAGAAVPDPLPTVSSTTAEYDSDVNLASFTGSVSGWSFVGWNTSPNGTGSGYAAGANGKLNLTADDGGSVTLYAYYTVAVYNITIENDGSSPLTFTYPSAVTSGSKAIILVTSTDANVYFSAVVSGAQFDNGSATAESYNGVFVIKNFTGPVTLVVTQHTDPTSSGLAGRFAIANIQNTTGGNEVSLYIDSQSTGVLPSGTVSLKGVFFDTYMESGITRYAYGNLSDRMLESAYWSATVTYSDDRDQSSNNGPKLEIGSGVRTCDAVMTTDVNVFSARAFFTPTGTSDPTDSTAWTIWSPN